MGAELKHMAAGTLMTSGDCRDTSHARCNHIRSNAGSAGARNELEGLASYGADLLPEHRAGRRSGQRHSRSRGSCRAYDVTGHRWPRCRTGPCTP